MLLNLSCNIAFEENYRVYILVTGSVSKGDSIGDKKGDFYGFLAMDPAEPPGSLVSPRGENDDRGRQTESAIHETEAIAKEGLNKRGPSKGSSWAEIAQDKKVLKRYELDITEQEGQKVVEIPDEILNNANHLWEDYLIGKFLDTAPHIARVHAIVNKIWQGGKSQQIEVHEVDATTMKFRVSDPLMRARILRRGMWNIGNIPLIVTKWTPDELKEKPEVKSIPLWVYLKNVPMNMYSWQGLSFIVSAAGFPVRLHPETASCSNFKLAKIFVNADLTKELPRKINFTKE